MRPQRREIANKQLVQGLTANVAVRIAGTADQRPLRGFERPVTLRIASRHYCLIPATVSPPFENTASGREGKRKPHFGHATPGESAREVGVGARKHGCR